MTILKHQIAQHTKGARMEKEDWWHLCYDTDTEKFYIEHSWSHVDAYNSNAADSSGSEQFAIEGWDGPGEDQVAEARATLEEQAQNLDT